MNDEQLDKLFQDELRQRETSPNADTWAKIAATLDQERKVIPFWQKSWVRYAAAVAVVLSVSIWAVQHAENTQQKQQTARQDFTPKTPIPVQPPVDNVTSDQNGATEGKIAQVEKVAPSEKPRNAKLVAALRGTEVSSTNRTTAVHDKPTLARTSVSSLPDLSVAKLQTNEQAYSDEKLKRHQVVEIDPIQPLIENPEEEETMLAAQSPNSVGLVPGLLNKISEVVNPDENKTIHFSNDEEGSLRIDIFNSLVKNRNRKRK